MDRLALNDLAPTLSEQGPTRGVEPRQKSLGFCFTLLRIENSCWEVNKHELGTTAGKEKKNISRPGVYHKLRTLGS